MKAKDWDKVAKDYFDEILSPFGGGVKHPIFYYIDKIRDKKRKTVIDLGTGVGPLIPKLSKCFSRVIALDFSREMLNQAKKNNKHCKNVKYAKQDMRDLSKFNNQVDVAIAINSILIPSIRDVNKIFFEVYNILKKGGMFIGVFPSLGSVIYQAILTYDRELERCDDEEVARKRTYHIIGKDDYDFLLGIFKCDEDQKQKFYYKFEIEYRLKKSGFKKIKIDKVYYPWELTDDEKLKELKRNPKFYDWFAIAKK